MFAIGMLNYGVELEVVKGLAFALLCFALLWGWGLASFVLAAVYCFAGVSEQINQLGAVAVSARTIAKVIIFRIFYRIFAARGSRCNAISMRSNLLTLAAFFCTKLQLVAVERNQLSETREHDDVAGTATICTRLGILYFYALMATMRVRLFLVVC